MTGSDIENHVSPETDTMASRLPEFDDMNLAEMRALYLDRDLSELSCQMDTTEADMSDNHAGNGGYQRLHGSDVSAARRQERAFPTSRSVEGQEAHINTQNGGILNFEEMIVDINSDDDPVDVFRQDDEGDSFLHLAVIMMNVHVVRYLLSLAPSREWLSMQNAKFQTALHLAVVTSQAEVVQMLLDAGINVTRKDEKGCTALQLACRNGNLTIVNKLLTYIKTCSRDCVETILNTSDYEGKSCLHDAATNGYINIMQSLITNGADVNAIAQKSGRTVLHTACADGQIKVVRHLLKNPKCDLNARAYDDATPFDLARARGHSEVTLALAVAGAKYRDTVE